MKIGNPFMVRSALFAWQRDDAIGASVSSAASSSTANSERRKAESWANGSV